MQCANLSAANTANKFVPTETCTFVIQCSAVIHRNTKGHVGV